MYLVLFVIFLAGAYFTWALIDSVLFKPYRKRKGKLRKQSLIRKTKSKKIKTREKLYSKEKIEKQKLPIYKEKKFEVKKSTIGKNSKVNHLSYIGDTTIGSKSNIGAGTITCNYDGKKKFKTKIKNDVFVGSNTSLVAPITLHDKSIIGAGSVITKNVKSRSLALTRASHQEIKNYKRKKK